MYGILLSLPGCGMLDMWLGSLLTFICGISSDIHVVMEVGFWFCLLKSYIQWRLLTTNKAMTELGG